MDKELIKKLKDEAINRFERIKGEFKELENGYLALIDEEQIKSLRQRNKSYIAQRPIYAKVEKITRDIMKTYFNNDKLAEIEIENEPKLTKILQDEINAVLRINPFYNDIREVITDMLVYGTGISKVYWSQQNGLTISKRKIDEVLIDPHAKSFYDAKYFVDRFYISIGDLKRQFKLSDKDIKELKADLGDFAREQIFEVYTKTDNEWRISILFRDKFLKFNEPLKLGLPFIWWIYRPQFARIDEKDAILAYGGAYISPMIPLQKQLIVTRNQQMDAINAQLNPRFFATQRSGLRDDDLRNNLLKVKVFELGEIKQIPSPDIGQSIFDTNKIDEELQEVGGLSKMSLGINQTPRNATAASLLNESGNATIDDIISGINENSFEPFVKRITKLIYAYKTSYALKDYNRELKIEPLITINAGNGSLSREVKISNIDSLINNLALVTKMANEAGATDKAMKYFLMIDEAVAQRARLTGVKNVNLKF